MPNQAHNFAYLTKQAWDVRDRAEQNACIRAQTAGAERLGPFIHDGYVEVEGDLPASLWCFPDGSTFVIGDNGNWIRSVRARRHGVVMKEWAERAVPRHLTGSRDGVRLIHAVPSPDARALCGARPNKQSSWSDEVDPQVTCPRCLTHLHLAKRL